MRNLKGQQRHFRVDAITADLHSSKKHRYEQNMRPVTRCGGDTRARIPEVPFGDAPLVARERPHVCERRVHLSVGSAPAARLTRRLQRDLLLLRSRLRVGTGRRVRRCRVAPAVESAVASPRASTSPTDRAPGTMTACRRYTSGCASGGASRAIAMRPLGAEPSTSSRSTTIATPRREKSKSCSCSGELVKTVSRGRRDRRRHARARTSCTSRSRPCLANRRRGWGCSRSAVGHPTVRVSVPQHAVVVAVRLYRATVRQLRETGGIDVGHEHRIAGIERAVDRFLHFVGQFDRHGQRRAGDDLQLDSLDAGRRPPTRAGR